MASNSSTPSVKLTCKVAVDVGSFVFDKEKPTEVIESPIHYLPGQQMTVPARDVAWLLAGDFAVESAA